MSAVAAVLMMTRAPLPGQTKTRLEPLLGPVGCARLGAALIAVTAATVRSAKPASLHAAVDPPAAAAQVTALAGQDITAFGQHGANLGARMAAAVAHVFAAAGGPVIVIGTDAPTLPPAHIVQATSLLEAGHDVVFGPAQDGGYYLIALARPIPQVFDLDPGLWGGPLVLHASIAAAHAAGLSVGFLPVLRDLDTPEDARALIAESALPASILTCLTAAGDLA